MYKLFTIVVTYNGSKWIDRCFGSLQQSTIPINIIAIDNGSTDGTPEIIHNKFPSVQVIQNGENLGFGKANNIGIRKAYDAGADYVFLLNQDAWVETDTIEKLVSVAETYKDFGIVSPVHIDRSGKSLDFGFMNYLCRNNNKTIISDLFIKSKSEIAEIYEIEFVNAAFWLLSRQTIEVVGGFNPFFFQYGEDRDYVNRCHYFNMKVGFVPSAVAYHDRVQFDSDFKNATLKRNALLLELFDPRNSNNISRLVSILQKKVIKDILRLRLQQLKSDNSELRYYQHNFKTILKISEMVKKTGLTFL